MNETEINNSSKDSESLQKNQQKFDKKQFCELMAKSDDLNSKTKDQEGNPLNVSFAQNNLKYPKEIPTNYAINKGYNQRNNNSFSTNMKETDFENDDSLNLYPKNSSKKINKIKLIPKLRNNLSQAISNCNSQELLLMENHSREASKVNIELDNTESGKEKETEQNENKAVVYSILNDENENLVPFGRIIANNIQVVTKHKFDEKKNDRNKNFVSEYNTLGKPGFILINKLQKNYFKIH